MKRYKRKFEEADDAILSMVMDPSFGGNLAILVDQNICMKLKFK